MVYCIRCDEEVDILTKTTGTCPTCAKEELETGVYIQDDFDDKFMEGDLVRTNIILERSLEEEGFAVDDIPDRPRR